MNNVINRHASIGKPINERKVIGVAKNPLYKPQDSTPETVPSTGETVKSSEQTAEVAKVVESAPTREQKRQEYSALEKARNLEKKARDEVKQAQELADAYQSKDLNRIAKASGFQSVNDYIRWVNVSALQAPVIKELTPEQAAQASAMKWKEEVDTYIKKDKEDKGNNNKFGYINKNILPHIVKDPDKYEFIMDRGVDDVCDEVYVFMNDHYNETGGPGVGEELDPIPLLEALEEQYMNDWQAEEKAREEKRAKLKKLQSKSPDTKPTDPNVKTVLNSEGQPAKVIGAKTVAHPSAKSEAEIFADINGGALGSEDALAETAPSNFVAGPSHGSTPKATRRVGGGFSETGGVTPKGSKFSRESRLAQMASKE